MNFYDLDWGIILEQNIFYYMEKKFNLVGLYNIYICLGIANLMLIQASLNNQTPEQVEQFIIENNINKVGFILWYLFHTHIWGKNIA